MHSTLKPLLSEQMIYSSCFSSELHTSASPRQRWWTQQQVIFLRLTETWQVYSRASTCSCHHRVSHRYAWKCNLPSQSLFTVSCWSIPCNSRPLNWRWKAILALATSLPGTFSPNQSCRVQTGQEKIPEVCLGKLSLQQKDWDIPLKVHLNAKVHISRPKKKYKNFSCAGDKAGTWHLWNKNYDRQTQL